MAEYRLPVASLRLELTLSAAFSDRTHLDASDAADSPALHRRIEAAVRDAIRDVRGLSGVEVECRPAWQANAPPGPG